MGLEREWGGGVERWFVMEKGIERGMRGREVAWEV
jgi:hypothetical protein